MDSSVVQGIINFLSADLRLATPILLAAIGMIYSERAGIVNIGAEGMMLAGALAGVIGSFFFGSAWYGALLAVTVGGFAGLIFGFIVITLQGNQIVTGIAFNLLGLGLTTSFSRVILGSTSQRPEIDSFTAVAIPLLSDIPILGPVLFKQSIIVYFTIGMVFITYFILYKTTWGLKVRAVGDSPKAADTVGVNVYFVRYQSIIIGGMLAGLGGAFISLGLVSLFTENMVAGRGFIAIAAVIFGKWNPFGVLLAALLFGAGDATVFRLQSMGTDIPYQFIRMIPYIITIAALAGFVGKSRAPAASGIPYDKE
ncbi:MAG: ABC transporter permease [Bacillota bacterium]